MKVWCCPSIRMPFLCSSCTRQDTRTSVFALLVWLCASGAWPNPIPPRKTLH